MKKELEKIKKEILDELENIKSGQALEDLEIKFLGRKGELNNILKKIKDLSNDQKKEIGRFANQVKSEITERIEELKGAFEKKEDSFVDVTLPGKKIKPGRLHPITQIQRELEDIFSSMGFMIMEGPELESDYYNFEVLNIPKDHPARDMQDTFFIDKKDKDGRYDTVMRTQVTSIQVRAIEKYGAPLRCIMPGRVFRAEDIDACHEHTFYQMDGFMVGKNLSVANMITLMKEVLAKIFPGELKMRTRPGYFPFVEPGIEIDVSCTICGGQGCSACKNSGWLEIFPGGMIHPNVLKAAGLDPEEYNGFAFDIGVTRLAMMKYGVDNIRLFNSGDLRFLEQF
ncbi:phenylalanine--tRNA ligase subunit alpha [Candidatus Falkowbacteria bacterium]|nr:phenylalanine--tRNA ligase subunit alpha [Candidatus Falkowbacteria bacterium]